MGYFEQRERHEVALAHLCRNEPLLARQSILEYPSLCMAGTWEELCIYYSRPWSLRKE